MADDDKQFVQIPTMTIHKPKKKQAPRRVILIGLLIMGIGALILIIAALVVL